MRATTIRMEDTVLDRVGSMAKNINQAVEHFSECEECFIQEVQAGMKEAASGEIASPEKVKERLARWGVNAD